MKLTNHQAKYFAYELSKKCKSDSSEKFGATLMDAKVDLNPHQVEAALFAFKSPLSNGAILEECDEMIDGAEEKLNRTTNEQEIFTIEWELI